MSSPDFNTHQADVQAFTDVYKSLEKAAGSGTSKGRLFIHIGKEGATTTSSTWKKSHLKKVIKFAENLLDSVVTRFLLEKQEIYMRYVEKIF